MGNTVSFIVIGLIAAIALGIAIAALVEAVETASPQNFFKINRSPGFYSMYGPTTVTATVANTASSIIGGADVGENILPANFLKPGGSFVVQASGVYEAFGSAQSVAMALSLAPTVVVVYTPLVLAAGQFAWQFYATVTCIDVSNVALFVSLSIDGQTINASGNVGFDTTNKQTIGVTVQFSNANSPPDKWSTTSLQEYFVFEQLKTLLWP